MTKKGLIGSLLASFVLLVVSCGRQAEAELDVMTFNVRLDAAVDSFNNWKYRKENVSKMLAYYEPDIVGMQEVLKNQLDDLKERMPDYTALGVGREDGKEKGEYCPLFYKTDRFDLVDYGNFSLSETPDTIGVKGWDAACERITTWAVLKDKKSGRQVAAFNTHFDHMGQIARRESAMLILQKIQEIAGDLPAVLTGDFNGDLYSEPVEILEKNGMENTYMKARVVYGPVWSYHNFGRLPLNQRELIDYIFVKGPVVADKCRVIEEQPVGGYLSDHAPVLSHLELK